MRLSKNTLRFANVFSETQTWKNKKGEILVDKQLEKIRKHIVESIDDLLSNIKTYKKKKIACSRRSNERSHTESD